MPYFHNGAVYVQVPVTGVEKGKLDAKRGSPWCYYDTVPGYGNGRPLGQVLVEYGRTIIKEFSAFDNTLAFTVGNEVFLQSTVGYTCLPCLKAYVRDLHLYMDYCKHSMRAIPLVYASENTADTAPIAEYLTCVGHEAEAAGNTFDKLDMLGINTYAYCSELTAFPYQDILRDFSTYDIPMFFSEFGCNQGDFAQVYPYQVGGRTFKQVDFMMNSMKDSFSGGMVYEYSMHSNGYGARAKGCWCWCWCWCCCYAFAPVFGLSLVSQRALVPSILPSLSHPAPTFGEKNLAHQQAWCTTWTSTHRLACGPRPRGTSRTPTPRRPPTPPTTAIGTTKPAASGCPP